MFAQWQDLNHHVSGWIDWNLALDQTGGPNWVKNFVDSPVIVDKHRDVFYKQPTFYSMAHFRYRPITVHVTSVFLLLTKQGFNRNSWLFFYSKFLWEGSQRVGVSASQDTELKYTVFVRPDNSVILIILNRYSIL